jgi:hypothetical protein
LIVGHAPAAYRLVLSTATNRNAATAFASAAGSWVTWYSRASAMESHIGTSLQPSDPFA